MAGVGRRSEITKKRMRRSAEARKCPRCDRRSALKRMVVAGAPEIEVDRCRWCGAEILVEAVQR